MIATVFSCFSMVASATTSTAIKSAITYNSNTGYTSYISNTYTISKNKTVTLKGYWINGNIALSKQKVDGKLLKPLLMFDVHIIDKKTGQVVNYWYNLKVGDKFKVYSAVPNINRSEYTVKVTSYLSNYRTWHSSSLIGAAANLKYRLSY